MSRKAREQKREMPANRRRAVWLKQVLVVALLAGLLLSRPLWLATRAFPCCPVASWLPAIPFPVDYAWYVALILLLIAALFLRQPRWCLVAFAVLAGLLGLWDQNRWQPWLYQYILMALALAWFPWRTVKEMPDRADAALDACRIIIAGTYFWSGVHKVNYTFVNDTFPRLVEPLLAWLPEALRPNVRPVGYLAGPVELAIGLGLLVPRLRQIAVAASWLMHLFLLLCLGPLGHNFNTLVWPWNLAMMGFTGILFWKTGERSTAAILSPRHRLVPTAALLLVGILPALRLVDLLDTYLAAELYSGRTALGAIYLRAPSHEKLPPEVRPYAIPAEEGYYRLEIAAWALGELNAPPYPEVRVYRAVARHFCTELCDPLDVILEVAEPPGRFDGASRVRRWDCSQKD